MRRKFSDPIEDSREIIGAVTSLCSEMETKKESVRVTLPPDAKGLDDAAEFELFKEWKATNKASFNRQKNFKKIQDILTKAAMDLAPIETIWQNQDKDPDEVDTIVQNLVKDTNKEEPKQEGTGM